MFSNPSHSSRCDHTKPQFWIHQCFILKLDRTPLGFSGERVMLDGGGGSNSQFSGCGGAEEEAIENSQ